MALNASTVKKSGGGVPPLEAGSYPSRLVGIVDLGLQPQKFNDEVKAPVQEVQFVYELSDEFIKDEEGEDQLDKPRWLSENFPFHNIKADKAKSTLRIKVLDPDNKYKGDIVQMLGTPVMLAVVQNPSKGVIYNKIVGISQMRKREADKLPDSVNKAFSFDLEDPDIEVFKKLPEWVRKKIQSNLEYAGSILQRRLAENGDNAQPEPEKRTNMAVILDDDVPF